VTKIVPNTPPAPEGQQVPPTRAAASDSWRSLRSARGSLPLTSGTASQRAKPSDKKKKDNAQCFYEGYRAGQRGEPRRSPYPAGTHESWSWTGGWTEGDERRRQDTRKLDANRQP
jgi:hypothetical protein